MKNLVSNQDDQWPLSQAQVEKAIADFDLNQIDPVKVSRRDGINYIFNAQHTIEIVATVSGSRETPVWCMIYDSLDYRNAADIFANQMKQRIYTKYGYHVLDRTLRLCIGTWEGDIDSLGYTEAMPVAYNRKCKYTLRMTKLHSDKVAEEGDFIDEPDEALSDEPVLEV